MKRVKYLSFFLLIALLCTALLNSGCKKDEPVPPELPPMELMMMDFSGFGDPSDTLNGLKSTSHHYHWGTAFLQVSFWHSLVTVGTAIPVAAYVKALSQTPVYLGDNIWEWRYQVVAEQKGLNVKLVTEHISKQEYTAAMYVTVEVFGGSSDFKLLEGTVRYDHTHATWTLYENMLTPSPLLRVEWNRDRDAGTGDLTYTNIRPGGSENGSYIHFSYDQGGEYDAMFMISRKAGESVIEWNTELRYGRIMSDFLFGNIQWRCWNGSLQNIECQ
jgi:hypothetical protein